MSVASEITRLQTAKENIKSAIEEKGVTVGDGTIDTYAEKINEISGNISDNYYDTFWDNFQDYGNRTDYRDAFTKGWTDENYNPKYPITCADNGASSIFTYNDEITDTKVDIDVSNITTGVQHIFNGCKALKTIKKLIVSDLVTSYYASFSNCNNLENITFEGEISISISFSNSSKLSDLSIQNIIDHLADLTGGTAQTLTLHATVGEKLTDEQKATITAKNWTLVY